MPNSNLSSNHSKKEPDLVGKVIVITGASSGFGKGAARKFAEEGAHVVLAARRTQLLEELAKECRARGVRALVVTTDVGKEKDMRLLAEMAWSEFGRIDAWINNAGVGAVGRFEDIPLADHQKLIQTDLMGTIIGSHLALNLFCEQGHGILINVASVLGKIPAPYYASYTAAKHGIVGLSAAIRQELSENGLGDKIRVCTVCPMAMDTPFFEHAADYSGHEVVPIPPLYEPERVVDTLVRLALHPLNEVVVGPHGKGMMTLHNLLPAGIEKAMAKQTHYSQMKQAKPASDTSGSVFEPMAAGNGLSGGRLVKRKEEEVERKMYGDFSKNQPG